MTTVRLQYEMQTAEVFLIQGFICGLAQAIRLHATPSALFERVVELEKMYCTSLNVPSQMKKFIGENIDVNQPIKK